MLIKVLKKLFERFPNLLLQDDVCKHNKTHSIKCTCKQMSQKIQKSYLEIKVLLIAFSDNQLT